jgi:plasmid stabilization system protein ParE
VRMWRVAGFENFLIFYRLLKDRVAIERVFHAKQDYRRVLK